MSICETVAENVKYERQRRGWSMKQFATRSGLSISLISHLERGMTDIRLNTLEKIARGLDEPVAELVVSQGRNAPPAPDQDYYQAPTITSHR